MNDASTFARALDAGIRALEGAFDGPSPNEAELLGELHALSERFAQERLQLAVIGQFKRGKSTLLNALLGENVLPSGVLPVTALTTWLEPGPYAVLLSFDDGHHEAHKVLSAHDAHAILEKFVSEANNPHNRLGVRQVHVHSPAPLLESGIVMIDTPGVGSTLEHNTKAAEAALPHADVALFVLSPDPPITQVEIDYVKAVREHAARTIVVLNKCDLLSVGEREETVEFVRKALNNNAGIEVDEILCVSARNALTARQSGDAAALKGSGIQELEQRLVRFARDEKGGALEEAIEKKAARLVAGLHLENEVALRAIAMSIQQLARCADDLQHSMGQIDLERQRARDLLVGDRTRLVGRVRGAAEEVGERVRRSIFSKLHDVAGGIDDPDRFSQELLDHMVEGFAREFPQLQRKVSEDLRSTLESHMAQAQRLARSIRIAASTALDIDLGAEDTTIDAHVNLKPAWYDRRIEFLAPVPPGTLDPLLPRGMRMKRAAARIRKDLEAALVRNVEKLRWSLQQAVEQSFRSFEAALDRHLNILRSSTADAVRLALQRRREETSDRSGQIAARNHVRELLDKMCAATAKGGLDGAEPMGLRHSGAAGDG